MDQQSVFLDSPQAISQHLEEDIPRHEFDRPGLRFVVCDERNRVHTHLHVDDVPPDREEIKHAVNTMVGVTGEFPGMGMVVVAMRPGIPTLTAADGVLYHAAHAACAKHGVRLLGVHVLTPHGRREVRLDDALESAPGGGRGGACGGCWRW